MVEAARLLTYKAAWLKDEHARWATVSVAEVKQAASIAKLYTTEAAVTATRIATQVFGGNGFMEEYPVARFYRDAKILEIGEGTSEVQRMLIARGLGLPCLTRADRTTVRRVQRTVDRARLAGRARRRL